MVSKVVPDNFWGETLTQEHNKTCFLRHVHHFIHLRRFESMSLHEVMQGMKVREAPASICADNVNIRQIHDIAWLAPPGLGKQKSSQSDTRKRIEIFYEFLYYLFDSFLIPLIRSNFYVTESSVDRYRLFFFRHDVWRYVAEPAMASLKTKLFEEVGTDDALRFLSPRPLGLSHLRLLPKQAAMRPIMNLRRRALPPRTKHGDRGQQGDKKRMGDSINTILRPIGSVLKLETVGLLYRIAWGVSN